MDGPISAKNCVLLVSICFSSPPAGWVWLGLASFDWLWLALTGFGWLTGWLWVAGWLGWLDGWLASFGWLALAA